MSSARVAVAGSMPQWLTYDGYGTLIRWDESLVAAVETILIGWG